jgi:hypothetical protein
MSTVVVAVVKGLVQIVCTRSQSRKKDPPSKLVI